MLTGWPIAFRPVGVKSGQTSASLDRIDSHQGYVLGNLQWVHKDIQRMKSDFSQERFLEVCSAVSQKAR